MAVTVVHGLTYLYDAHRIIHRDVKPSNILVNSRGQIKICDFGVSGELINSIADTFVGTSTYMSVSRRPQPAHKAPQSVHQLTSLWVHLPLAQPERIQGDQYSVKSDVWSLGITIIEIALGRFPFAEDDDEEEEEEDLRGTLSPTRPNGGGGGGATTPRRKDGVSLDGGGHGSTQMSMLELLQRIVNEPPPRLPAAPASTTTTSTSGTTTKGFPPAMVDFVDLCVTKDPHKRPTPKELTKNAYIEQQVQQSGSEHVDLKKWVDSLV